MKPQLHCPQSRGFALVVALSLMILLTIIAVGLLTLSSISLRASSQENAMAEARSNARLALMLAIGDLQKSLGPDRAITAPSEILATPTTSVAKPNTTGVWESWWDFNPNGAPDYGSEKTSRFRRWLVASADMAAAGSRDFVTTGWTGKSIELVGNGSLGAAATNAGKVTAGLVPVSKNGKVQGAYGWHVSDESVKARINHYRDPGQNTTLAQRRALLAGHRPDPSVMKGPDGSLLTCLPNDRNPASYTNPKSSVGKIIDLNQAELLDNARDKIKPFRNDVTPYGHCMRPQFNCTLRLWFDRGGIYVMANLRGGGEFGTEWHLNGNLTRKQNVCGRDLLSTRFHSSRSPPGRGLIFTGFARPRPRGTAPPAGVPPIRPAAVRTRIPPVPGKPSEIRTSSFENNCCVFRGGVRACH